MMLIVTMMVAIVRARMRRRMQWTLIMAAMTSQAMTIPSSAN